MNEYRSCSSRRYWPRRSAEATPTTTASPARIRPKTRSSARQSLDPDQARLKYARCLHEGRCFQLSRRHKKIPNGSLCIPKWTQKAWEKWEQAGGAKVLSPNKQKTHDRFL